MISARVHMTVLQEYILGTGDIRTPNDSRYRVFDFQQYALHADIASKDDEAIRRSESRVTASLLAQSVQQVSRLNNDADGRFSRLLVPILCRSMPIHFFYDNYSPGFRAAIRGWLIFVFIACLDFDNEI